MNSAFGFNLGGKNHLGSELQKYIKEYRELTSGYPNESHKLETFLETTLAPFLKGNKDAILEQCQKNGWTAEGTYNFKNELDRAIITIGDFLKNPKGGESPLFLLNEAVTQVHSFLINCQVNGS